MLRWRLFLGVLLAAVLLGLCWLDYWLAQVTAIPGLVLFPVLVAFVMLAGQEVLHLAAAGGVRPVPWVVYLGSLLVVASSWIAPLSSRLAAEVPEQFSAAACDWALVALAAAMILAFVAEMRRFQRPGGATVNVAVAVFAVVYVGLLPSFLIQLRLGWGLKALLSLLIVVKMSDTGAYTAGKLFGRHKMSPNLSPNKTVEGAAGAVVVACATSWAAWATLHWLLPDAISRGVPSGTWWGWVLFGLLIAAAGMIGDLAESLIKRDVGRKDSSHWMPGLGGVLDMLDSVLVTAPVAYACWALGLLD